MVSSILTDWRFDPLLYKFIWFDSVDMLQIISNTEVWDIRTETKALHLLKTVPLLNQCSIVFSPVNSALYAIFMEQEMSGGDTCFDSSFKTVDSSDYSSIGNRVHACLETVIYTDLLQQQSTLKRVSMDWLSTVTTPKLL